MRVLRLVLCLTFAGVLLLGSEAAKLYKQGQQAEHAGQTAKAYLLYSQAAALEPENQLYWVRSQALGERVPLAPKPAPPGTAAAGIEAPTVEDVAEARKPLPPQQLSAKNGRLNFDLRGDSKQLFGRVANAFDLDCVFDGDYQPTQPFRFIMDQADYREALHALEAATSSFVIPLSPRLFMVAKDTPQKRNDLEPHVAVVANLPEPTSTQDLTGMITAVQQAMGIQRVTWDTQKNIVILRDAISKVLPARDLLEQLLYPRAQVVIDLEFLELSHSEALSYGVTFPDSFPLVALTTKLGNVATIPSGIARLALFGGGGTMFGLGIADATLVANMSRSSGKVMLRAELRSIDGQPAVFHIGDRYPVLTGGYFGPASFSGPGAVSPPPSFTFEDLGLSLKITPNVNGMESVTLDVESEFRLLTGQSANGIPVISNRQLKSTVLLPTGQWAVVGGMMDATQARTIAGLAGLSRLPYLGALFSKRDNTRDSSDVLIVMRPRLVTPPPTEVVTHTFRLGSGARPLTPL